MKIKKTKVKTNLEIIKAQRGSWGSISPVTKIIRDKRRDPPKHKGHQFED